MRFNELEYKVWKIYFDKLFGPQKRYALELRQIIEHGEIRREKAALSETT